MTRVLAASALLAVAGGLLAPTRVPSRAARVARRAAASAAPDAAEALFDDYRSAAPSPQREQFEACWALVERVQAAAEAALPSDARLAADRSAFGGALAAFVTSGPDDTASVPSAQRELVGLLSDTAASYERLEHPRLAWGTRYRTLNRPLGAFFGGIQLWPDTGTDAPNFTLYFGSGSAANPDRVFMRLELVPRVDTDTDETGYCERYYEPFNDEFFAFAEDERFEPYVSTSAYARGALAPSGLRYFFEFSEPALARCEEAACALATMWGGFVSDAAPAADTPARRATLAERDAIVRRVAANSSPDNANRELVFGAEMFAKTKLLLMGDPDAR